ncbi:SAV_2336 N-terminal domain-related protein [Yinghuangia soli]|uniref:Tetratricopeptide repeat protein n=1 Tax=Yinghuangia soli TaxID=2908204 RepID=A0AA41Q3I5_9ACTN|nr:SAV_2336 N-terminal domain-related protein [Yinghuangia soli]MCF2530869.1 tetratricopeptide repeat protein [Yinghuangia soli]
MPGQLRRILADAGVDLADEELLDVLWLALRMPKGAAAPLARGRDVEAAAAEPSPTAPEPVPPAEARESAAPPPAPQPAPAADDPERKPLYAAVRPPSPRHEARRAGAAQRARPVGVPEAASRVGRDLLLARALRPLKQRVPDPRRLELDEERTVASVAETGIADAEMRPAPARWLSLALVVDDGVSMYLWQRLVADLRTLMEQAGAFRTVQVFGLDSRAADGPTLHTKPFAAAEAGQRLPPGAVNDPNGRTLVLVVSDGVGAAWRDGRMHAALTAWAGHGPTAVVHTLPRRLWAGTGIQAQEWSVTTRQKGGASAGWRVVDRLLPADLAPFPGVAVPVLAMEPGVLGAWARTISSPSAATLLPLLAAPVQQVPRTSRPPAPGTQRPAADAVVGFRSAASPEAYRLAAHLAAIAPVTVPVMHLVREAVGRTTDTGHLAEVLLGGLMRRLPPDQVGGMGFEAVFDFDEAARRTLMATLRGPELLQTAEAVAESLERSSGRGTKFAAWAGDSSGMGRIDETAEGFGWIGKRVLERLGVGVRAHGGTDGSASGKEAPPVGRPAAAPQRTRRNSGIPVMGAFVGRDAELDALDAALAEPGATCVVHGFLGSGKTALAAHWALTRNPTDECWWVKAGGTKVVDASLARLIRPLVGRTGLGSVHVAELAPDVRAVIQDDRILVLDGMRGPEELKRVRELLGDRVRILATTRTALEWGRLLAGVQDLPLQVLDPTDSLRLLERRLAGGAALTDGFETALGLRVCTALGHLPLAVEQVALECNLSEETFSAYVGSLTGFTDVVTAGALVGRGSGPTGQVWRHAVDTVGPEAAELVRAWGWLAPGTLHRDLARALTPRLEHVMRQLQASGLAVAGEEGTYKTPYVVQSLARTPDADDPHRQVGDIRRARDRVVGVLLGTFRSTPLPLRDTTRRALMSHADVVLAGYPEGSETDEFAYLLAWVNSFRAEEGNISTLVQDSRRCVEVLERVWGPDHVETLVARNALAWAHDMTGDVRRAIPLYEETLAGRESLLGEDHPDTLVTRGHLAGAYESSGDLVRAIPLLKRMIADRTRVLGEDHQDTLTSRSNLAGAYLLAGDLEQAITLHTQVLGDRTRVLGEDHPHTLGSRRAQAGAFEEAGNLLRAIPLLEQALLDHRRVLGPDHPDTLACANLLASALDSAGDLTRAVRMKEQTLSDRQRVFGPHHPDTLISMNNLAWTYQSAGELHRSIPLFEETLALSERLLGAADTSTIIVRSNLARAYSAVAEHARATSLSERAVADAGRVMSVNHIDALIVRTRLGHVYGMAGDAVGALRVLDDVKLGFHAIRQPLHPRALIADREKGLALSALGEINTAVVLLESTLTSQQQVLSPGHPEALTTWRDLAWAYRGQWRHDLAEDTLVDLLQDCEEALSPGHPLTRSVRDLLAELRS